MTRIEAVGKFLTKVRLAYIEDQRGKDIRTTGRSAASFRGVTEPEGGKLLATGYVHFQKIGRKPGHWPPIEDILQWIKDKGIQSDIPEKSLAFLIARKIFRKGTDIFLGKRPALSIEEKLLEARREFCHDLGRLTAEELIKQVKSIKPE